MHGMFFVMSRRSPNGPPNAHHVLYHAALETRGLSSTIKKRIVVCHRDEIRLRLSTLQKFFTSYMHGHIWSRHTSSLRLALKLRRLVPLVLVYTPSCTSLFHTCDIEKQIRPIIKGNPSKIRNLFRSYTLTTKNYILPM